MYDGPTVQDEASGLQPERRVDGGRRVGELGVFALAFQREAHACQNGFVLVFSVKNEWFTEINRYLCTTAGRIQV